MRKVVQFGENVDGYSIPVLNEREIRAASGILFLFAFITLMRIIFKSDFTAAKYFVVLFLIDFIIRVFINPRFSPTLIIGRMMVYRQTPEYVGAPQKKFAWKIGITLSLIMFVLLNIMNTYSAITGIICLICLIFLFFESVFGVCLGCIFYRMFYKEKAQYCPGEICELKDRTDIQRITAIQWIVVASFALLIVLLVVFGKPLFTDHPTILWEKFK